MKKQTNLVTLGLMLATPALAGGGGAPAAPATPAACKTIAQIVAGDPNFSTLATAVDAAGLTQTLQGGTYTVFAPTNAAFAKLPSDTLAAALNDPAMLRSLLLYHVVSGKVAAAQVATLSSVKTVEGSSILVTVSGPAVKVDNANVTRTNVAACNGVVHVIDTVLMPATEAEAPIVNEPVAEAAPAPAPAAEPAPAAAPAAPAAEPAPAAAPAAATPAAPAPVDISSIPALPQSGATITVDTATTPPATTDTAAAPAAEPAPATEAAPAAPAAEPAAAPATDTVAQAAPAASTNTLYDVLVSDDRFSTLRDLLSDAGLTEQLTANEYTIFAPTNAAFEALDQEQLALIASDPDTLRKVLLYHVVAGKQTGEQLAAVKQVSSAEGSSIDVSSDGTTQTVGTGKVEGAPIAADNGTIFVIDKVLLPPNLVIPAAPAAAAPATDTAAAAPAAPATTTDTTATPAAPATTTTPAPATTTTTPAPATTTTATATPANLVEVLQGMPQYSTLVSLIQKAGLVETLSSGDYTVFAPTNDAFAKVPQATLDMLNADPAKLRQVLLFHVVTGKVIDAALNVPQLKSVEGSSIDLKTDGSMIMIGVLSGDTITGGMIANSVPMTAGNSVAYSIDTVLIPPTLK
ncbi:fasciclin domain-containing protein [Deinococcus yunweiensis]|uniref:fasciclin domain-containing protein n=1 Tax=Deinococcus yunweiensis TaxID=367282 RepID=UPI00398ECC26